MIYISWCIFLVIRSLLSIFSLFCVSPFLSLTLSVALIFIFSVFVFLVLCLSPPCVPFIESVSSQCLFPPSSCVRSVSCFIFPVCPVCIVFCFASSLLSVCTHSSGSSVCVCQSPSDCCCIIPVCCVSMWAMFQSLIPSCLILVYSS